MTSDPLTEISIRSTPQSEQALDRPEQVLNAAGGYVFPVTPLTRLHRFLILGSAGGTFYTKESELTRENAKVVFDYAVRNPRGLVDEIVDISVSGRAPKQNPALFALAVAFSASHLPNLGSDATVKAARYLADHVSTESTERAHTLLTMAKLGSAQIQERMVGFARALAATDLPRTRKTAAEQLAEFEFLANRQYAADALLKVARTGDHLFMFVKYVLQFRGWGRALRRAIAAWYTEHPTEDVAYQVMKYRQRGGMSHKDLLQLSHALTDEPDRKALFDYLYGVEGAKVHVGEFNSLSRVEGHLRAMGAVSSPAAVARIIGEYRLPWEMIPDEAMNKVATWQALLDVGLPQTALMRQLPRLTRLGMVAALAPDTARVAAQLRDPDRLSQGRVHPINVLIAGRTYASGQSARGDSTWVPSAPIVDAYNDAFYAAFGSVEPSGRRIMGCIDVSGSMATHTIGDTPLTPREAAAAVALVTAATEPQHMIVAFSAGDGSRRSFSRRYESFGHPDDRRFGRGPTTVAISELPISPRQRMDDVLAYIDRLPFSGTDCSLPMQFAIQHKIKVDLFAIYTDNETWFGDIHPFQALRRYRELSGIDAKLVVVSFTATGHTIADPSDDGMLDIAGFDSAVPKLISNFAVGL